MRFWKWLSARWRYDLASLLALTVMVLVFTGRITVDTAMAFVLTIITLLVLDLRPQLERHRAEMVQLLTEVAAAGRAAQTHNVGAAVRVGELAVQDGAKLAEEVKAEAPKS